MYSRSAGDCNPAAQIHQNGEEMKHNGKAHAKPTTITGRRHWRRWGNAVRCIAGNATVAFRDLSGLACPGSRNIVWPKNQHDKKLWHDRALVINNTVLLRYSDLVTQQFPCLKRCVSG